jgi:hypothetical protein
MTLRAIANRRQRLGRTGALFVVLPALATMAGALAQEAEKRPAPPQRPTPSAPAPQDERASTTPTDSKGQTTASPASPSADPDLLRVHLTDGTIVSGKFSVSHVAIQTQYGLLQVPLAHVQKISPGLSHRPQLRAQVEGWIEDLGDNNLGTREAAQRALLQQGPGVRRLLAAHAKDPDKERAKRIGDILEELDQIAAEQDEIEETDPWREEDVVGATAFTAAGSIVDEQFEFVTRYGTLRFEVGDIVAVDRPSVRGENVRRSLTLAVSYMGRFLDSRIKLNKGDRIIVEAQGVISPHGSRSYDSTPEGNPRLGQSPQDPSVFGGAVVARVGGGKPMKVGSKATLVAPASGKLELGIAAQTAGIVTRGRAPTGEYKLTVRVVRSRTP